MLAELSAKERAYLFLNIEDAAKEKMSIDVRAELARVAWPETFKEPWARRLDRAAGLAALMPPVKPAPPAPVEATPQGLVIQLSPAAARLAATIQELIMQADQIRKSR